jgi:hypothetical protein
VNALRSEVASVPTTTSIFLFDDNSLPIAVRNFDSFRTTAYLCNDDIINVSTATTTTTTYHDMRTVFNSII